MGQLDLFSDIADFKKEQALDVAYVLKRYKYDIKKCYYIMRYNYARHTYEVLIYEKGNTFKSMSGSITECSRHLYETIIGRKYREDVLLELSEFIDYDVVEII